MKTIIMVFRRERFWALLFYVILFFNLNCNNFLKQFQAIQTIQTATLIHEESMHIMGNLIITSSEEGGYKHVFLKESAEEKDYRNLLRYKSSRLPITPNNNIISSAKHFYLEPTASPRQNCDG